MKPFRLALSVATVALVTTSTLVLAQALQKAPPEQVGMSSERIARLSKAFKEEVDQSRLPGVVMMVSRKGRLVYSEAIGSQDKAKGTPMKEDTIFRIYSMTKPLVSVAAMMLIEDGRMQLTDPVSKFLPAFKGQTVSVPKADSTFARVTYTTVPVDRESTVQDLLRHTAGLGYGEITQNAPVKSAYEKAGVYTPKIRDFDARDMTPLEQSERVGRIPLVHQPGTVWEYSLASDLLGRVVESAAGKRLGDFLDERLFKQLVYQALSD